MKSAPLFPKTLNRPYKRYPDYYRRYLWSKVAALFMRKEWKDVHTVSLFVGYPRTGASMMGALLDAHPDMVFAQELNLLRANEAGLSRDQIYALILRSSRHFAETGALGKGHKARGPKYSYAVPGQWQGRYRKLLVMGDKQAPDSTNHLTGDPHLVAKLAHDFGVRVRMIHMIRNPFDCINGIFRLKSGRGGPSKHTEIRQSVDYHLALVDGMVEIQRRYGGDVLDLRLEDLLADPAKAFSRTCDFLGVSCPEDYVKACTGILFGEAKSVTDAKWSLEEIARVQEKIAAVPFLHGYTVPPLVEASARDVAG